MSSQQRSNPHHPRGILVARVGSSINDARLQGVAIKISRNTASIQSNILHKITQKLHKTTFMAKNNEILKQILI